MNDPIERALGLRPINEALSETETEVEFSESEMVELEVIEEKEASVPITQEQLQAGKELEIKARLAEDETLRDIEKARKNIEEIIELGGESLHEMISLAKQSESPRAFEVASGMMKTLLDANREFVEMSTRKKYAKEEITNPKEEAAAAQTSVTNNNLILSTADMLKMIRGEI